MIMADKQPSGSKPQDTVADVVEQLLRELEAVESELSPHPETRSSPATKARGQGKAGSESVFRAVLRSPAFASDKERAEYLVQEVEASGRF